MYSINANSEILSSSLHSNRSRNNNIQTLKNRIIDQVTFLLRKVGADNLQITDTRINLLNSILLNKHKIQLCGRLTLLTSAVALKDKTNAWELSGSIEFSIKITSMSLIRPHNVNVAGVFFSAFSPSSTAAIDLEA